MIWFFWIYYSNQLLLWLIKGEKYDSMWLHTQKNEHIPKKIKLYDQINHFIDSGKMTRQGKNIIWSDYLIRWIYLSGNAIIILNGLFLMQYEGKLPNSNIVLWACSSRSYNEINSIWGTVVAEQQQRRAFTMGQTH